MKENLVAVLEDRRRAAGNGNPLGYKAWGGALGIVHTTLFRFAKGKCTLGVEPLRVLAAWAKANNDNELLSALREYVLSRFCEGDGTLGSEAVKALARTTNGNLLFILAEYALAVELPVPARAKEGM